VILIVFWYVFQAQGVVTEETIRDLFNGFGPVIDVAMKKCEIDHVSGKIVFA
jgi:hypothetical protein